MTRLSKLDMCRVSRPLQPFHDLLTIMKGCNALILRKGMQGGLR